MTQVIFLGQLGPRPDHPELARMTQQMRQGVACALVASSEHLELEEIRSIDAISALELCLVVSSQ